jgi:hypothetical protein
MLKVQRHEMACIGDSIQFILEFENYLSIRYKIIHKELVYYTYTVYCRTASIEMLVLGLEVLAKGCNYSKCSVNFKDFMKLKVHKFFKNLL